MTTSWQIGDVRVTKVVEEDAPVPGPFVLPDALPESLAEIPWLAPNFVTGKGWLKMSIHALVIESQGLRILVDTCVGNDKQRTTKAWAMRTGPFLEDLAAAGFPRESIDYVMCTHLHVDHVGWNTMRVDGRWVPTFPRARYLFARREWESWMADPQEEHFGPVMQDSVIPIVDAGLADLVEPDHRLNDEVWFEPTHGHTAGHISVHIASAGAEAVITGDMTHHPCQLAHPEWRCYADYDAAQAIQTRRDFYARYADTDVLVIGTHFAPPTAGRIVRDGDRYRLAC